MKRLKLPPASCDVWLMTKPVVSVAAIVGYNSSQMPWDRIKDVLVASLRYSTPYGFHILPKLIWCSSRGLIPGQSLCKHGPHVFDWR
ncbi:hypothetical protein TNCV_407861 [Trichonephila clavipes]|nr:hypothetical protein TNCV_407861 [Trichonephila clavipes]